jgi:hypothetical protein
LYEAYFIARFLAVVDEFDVSSACNKPRNTRVAQYRTFHSVLVLIGSDAFEEDGVRRVQLRICLID